VLPVIDALQSRLTLAAAVPISALTGDGVERVLSEIKSHLSEGPALYPEDQWTEVSERFLVAEIIREKIFQLTEQEIPYSTFVEVERFDEKDREVGMVRIYAAIVVEKKQQKGIVIGRGGDMLKQIGTLARKDICELLQSRVYLELFVKVEANWSRSRRGLRKVGFE
jgi:GTP-binding protein Era